MSQAEKPSDVLRRMSSKAPANTFLKLLEKNLYPALDEIPTEVQSHIIERLELAQQEADQAAKLLNLIQYDVRKESLNGQVKDLLKDVKRDWHDGYEEQGLVNNLDHFHWY